MKVVSAMVFIFLIGSSAVPGTQSADCENFKVTATVQHIGQGTKGAVTIEAKGNADPTYYIFHLEDGELVTKDVISNKVDKLDAGTYFCSVVDGTGCRKRVKFTIE